MLHDWYYRMNDLTVTHAVDNASIFNFDGLEVRTVERGGEPWFVGGDVCKVLDTRNPSDALSRLDDDEKDNLGLTDAIGRMRDTVVVNESGLYSLILSSRKPEAKRFKKWVTSVLLPAVRKKEILIPSKEESKVSNDAAVRFLELALQHLPNLCQTSKQALMSHVSEITFGQRLLPLPVVAEHLLLAGEVGSLLEVSGQRVGRLANEYGLKTAEYGEIRLSKSRHSDRQCETFYYNQAAVNRLREILGR